MKQFFIGNRDTDKEYVLELVEAAPRITKEGDFTNYLFTVNYQGETQQLKGTKGLADAIEDIGAKAGDTLSIIRHGSGTATRWEVAYSRDAVEAGEDEVQAPLDSPSERKLTSLEDGIAEFNWLINKAIEGGVAREHAALFPVYAYLASVDFRARPAPSPAREPERVEAASSKKPDPDVWVRSILSKAGIHPHYMDTAIERLSSGAIRLDSLSKDDAKWFYDVTNKGTDLSKLEALAAEFQDEAEQLPF